MGDTRTVVGMIQGIFSGTTYSVELAIDIVSESKEDIKRAFHKAYNTANSDSPVRANGINGVVVDTIPSLSSPVPEGWTIVNEDLTVFLASKTPWLARGMMSHPYALPDDGLLDLMIIGDVGIGKNLGVFSAVEKGKHLESDAVSILNDEND
jgi:sphingosine kinase